MKEINIQAQKLQQGDGYYVDPSELINNNHKIQPTTTTTEINHPVLLESKRQLRGINNDHHGQIIYAKVSSSPLRMRSITTDNPKVFVGRFSKLVEKVKERLYDELKEETDMEIETKQSEEMFETGPDQRLTANIKKIRVKKVTENAPIRPDVANRPDKKEMLKRRFQIQEKPKKSSKEVLEVIVNEMKPNETTEIMQPKSESKDKEITPKLIQETPIIEDTRRRNTRARHEERQRPPKKKRGHKRAESSRHKENNHRQRSHDTDSSKNRNKHRDHHKYKENINFKEARHVEQGNYRSSNKESLRHKDRNDDRQLRHHDRERKNKDHRSDGYRSRENILRNQKRKVHNNRKHVDVSYFKEETDFESSEKRFKVNDRKRKDQSNVKAKHSSGEEKEPSHPLHRSKKYKESIEYNFNDKTLYEDDIFSSDESSIKKPVHKLHNTGDSRSEVISWGSSLERRKNEPEKTTVRFTRPIFSISTPDYYKNQPNYAAKYDFNEPIPVRDQEDPRPKKLIANIPSNINGKKNLYVEGHLING